MSPSDHGFQELAAQAFDVMMRRKWWFTCSTETGWRVFVDVHVSDDGFVCEGSWPDPFTALVEADRWYRENCEKGK